MDLYEQVTEYVRNGYHEAANKKQRNVAFAMLILQRRLASSVRVVRSSLERRKARLEELLPNLKPLSSERAEPFSEESLEDLPEAERLQEEERLLSLTLAKEPQNSRKKSRNWIILLSLPEKPKPSKWKPSSKSLRTSWNPILSEWAERSF